MARQSPTNPRFRCNECKEFYHASDDDYNVHYQCPVHGYLCYDHTIDEECYINDDDEECGKKTIKYIWHEDEDRWIEKETSANVGDVYNAKVVKLMTFGAYAKILPGKQGLIHISEISKERVENVESVLSVGDTVDVKVIMIDNQGRISLSIKALIAGDKIDENEKNDLDGDNSRISEDKSAEVDVEKELAKYKDLLDRGIITQEEYIAKRKQILSL